jgi:hypothetical protein
MSYVAELKQRALQAEEERDYYASLVEAFNTGEVPEGYGSLQHVIMSQWGRRRLEEKKKTAALLNNN